MILTADHRSKDRDQDIRTFSGTCDVHLLVHNSVWFISSNIMDGKRSSKGEKKPTSATKRLSSSRFFSGLKRKEWFGSLNVVTNSQPHASIISYQFPKAIAISVPWVAPSAAQRSHCLLSPLRTRRSKLQHWLERKKAWRESRHSPFQRRTTRAMLS